ncbi:uncharacterized protein LOC143238887 [Tachypleus tridentatus]|uniref:uncharacterized protein LOC143238887 n=1 Tax=Tachypleus tridentatus TaxID=6853 RepID=UPI003FD62F31
MKLQHWNYFLKFLFISGLASCGTKQISFTPNLPNVRVLVPILTTEELNQVIQRAHLREEEIRNETFDSTENFHELNNSSCNIDTIFKAQKDISNISQLALLVEKTSLLIHENFKSFGYNVRHGLQKVNITGTEIDQSCPFKETGQCIPTKYRSIDGHCNNLDHPFWGNSYTRYIRQLPADYGNEINSPRISTNGKPLPSARLVSSQLLGGKDNHPQGHLSVLAVIWASFMLDDISHTTKFTGFRSTNLKCCNVTEEPEHPECFPIDVVSDDVWYGKYNQTCLQYGRSATVLREGCTLGPREQINQATSFLDGSVIYGTTTKAGHNLRVFRDGLLKTRQNEEGKEIPTASTCTETCWHETNSSCLDPRLWSDIGTMALYIVWVREHNRIARVLKQLNPSWNDEVLYQETRRVVVAELQHITYNEFIPVFLGFETVSKFGLSLRRGDYFRGYDREKIAGISNVVGLVMRGALLSVTPEFYELIGPKTLGFEGNVSWTTTLFHSSSLVYTSKLRHLIMGTLIQSAMPVDINVNNQELFSEGIDVMALLIQQSRDHGIPSYTAWRTFCGFPLVKSFEDLETFIDKTIVKLFQQIYKVVEDIDLLPGVLAERPLEGAMVGETLACLLGYEFYLLRGSDRFWYENDLPPSAFTLEQLQEVQKVTMTRILCDNIFNDGYIQPNSYRIPDPWLNNFVSCKDKLIPSVDLSKWRSEVSFENIPPEAIANALRNTLRFLEPSRAEVNITNFFNQSESHLENTLDPSQSRGLLRATVQSRLVHTQSVLLEEATRHVIQELTRNLDPVKKKEKILDILPSLQHVPLLQYNLHFEEPKVCDDVPYPCDYTTLYRTESGRCNNLDNPEFGKVAQNFIRLLPPAYDDDISSPRIRSVNGSSLPSPRFISVMVHEDGNDSHLRYTKMMMQFGQLIDHDITHTPIHEGMNKEKLDCRACDSAVTVHSECLPISVPSKDPYYPAVHKASQEKFCLPFTRSMSGQRTLGVREQINQVTAYIDGSAFYGSDDCEARALRTFHDGQLKMTKHPDGGGHKPLLPETLTIKDCVSHNGVCFLAGDPRVSEQPGLTTIHTIFAREHNRLALRLQDINPLWKDEQLYQETRRIVSASFQHIIYSEFLPRVLGWELMEKWGLTPLKSGYYFNYDPNCNAAIFNEFASAAFRFGHSLLPPSLKRMTSMYDSTENITLVNNFFDNHLMYNGGMIDDILRGLCADPTPSFDTQVTKAVTRHLFEDKNKHFSGLDLVSLNLQRGRDHGIRPYNDYREFCNITRASSFEDLVQDMPEDIVKKLSLVYRSVDDIDLFTGGLAELAVPGGLVGPTFACIIGFQFQKLRRCDRFWYENANVVVRFTKQQLQEIRKVTLAKIICENGDDIDQITTDVLDRENPFLNPRRSCESLPSIDLGYWIEASKCQVEGQLIDRGRSKLVTPCMSCTCTTEGPICRSLKIDNCSRLLRDFSRYEIMDDIVCRIQCAHIPL